MSNTAAAFGGGDALGLKHPLNFSHKKGIKTKKEREKERKGKKKKMKMREKRRKKGKRKKRGEKRKYFSPHADLQKSTNIII